MLIKYIETTDFNDLIVFNKEVYADRPNPEGNIIFWFIKNPAENNLSVILKGDSGEIWGQDFFSSMIFFYNNSAFNGEWGFDYIVREEKRKEGYGIDIMEFVLDNKKIPVFATGSGPLALQIELKMGFKQLGELKKYVGLANPLYLFTSVFRGIVKLKRYPRIVKVKGETFSLLRKENLPDISTPYNTNLLEFGRDFSFLKWRFYSDLHEYAFYKKDGTDDYFVLRTIVKNHITCSVLVDYRCNTSNQVGFKTILKAAKKVTRRLKIGILVTGSSLMSIDDILERNHFRATGRHRPIISTKSFIEEKGKIEKREFVFTTLADSDGEVLW